MSPEYVNDSLTFGLIGVPIGMILGYALAKTEDYFHHHPRRRRRDHT